MDRISTEFGGALPWASAPGLDLGAWAWVQTRVNRPTLTHRAGGRSSRQERKRVWAWLIQCVYFFLAELLDVFECKDRFYLNKKTYFELSPVSYFRTERMPA